MKTTRKPLDDVWDYLLRRHGCSHDNNGIPGTSDPTERPCDIHAITSPVLDLLTAAVVERGLHIVHSLLAGVLVVSGAAYLPCPLSLQGFLVEVKVHGSRKESGLVTTVFAKVKVPNDTKATCGIPLLEELLDGVGAVTRV